MKKILIYSLFLAIMIFAMPAMADIVPLSTKSIKHYGIGVLNMPKSYKVYVFPRLDSPIKREVNYDGIKKSAIVNTIDMRKISYVAYVPSNDVALLAVDMNPLDNWYQVYLNQSTGEMGWVYCENQDSFYTYRQMFYKWGKEYGIKVFNDLTEDEKVLYSKEDKTSKILDKFTYPKFITFTVIRGNWLLATVQDVTGAPKIGWFNWRNEDGTLNMFPNFKD
ncbi:hypothetical protein IJD44_07295 [bacterium]|nr:hypothetical protein [bacterium]